MVCTKCGAELKDTDLFCLHCGKEVQFVPDYNPVDEMLVLNLAQAQQNEIISMSTKDEKLNKQNRKDSPTTKTDKAFNIHKRKAKNKNKSSLIILAIAFIIVFATILFWNYYKNSYQYQYKEAQECMEEGDFNMACDHLTKALQAKNNDINAHLLMSDAYIGLNQIDDAISSLQDVLKIDSENVVAVKQLFEIYSNYNYIDELKELISKIDGTKLATELGDFYSNRPSYSMESGTYDKFISVEITSKENGDIFYTVDGTKPNSSAIQYSGQIRLRGGTTQIRAVAIDKNGEYSVETVEEYTVNSTVPENPEIVPASGQYSSPIPIRITVPDNCKVYYTVDGTEPTGQSSLYTKPLDMPLGNHTLSVVAIDSNDIVSNIIQSNYNLEFETRFTIEQAYDILIQKLGNELVDEKGVFYLECNSAIEIGGFNLYAFEKVYGTDENGNKIYGTDKYAFDVLTAETFQAVVNAAGGYDLNPF